MTILLLTLKTKKEGWSSLELGTSLTVKISDLDLSYRHDIYLRQYVLESMEQLVYDQYMHNVNAMKAPKRRRTFDGFMQLAADVQAKGQLDAIPVEAVLYEDGWRLVPRDGAHRLAILRHLGHTDVQVEIIELVRNPASRSPGYTVDGERSMVFNNIKEEALEYAKQSAEEESVHCRKFSERSE